MKRNTLFKAFMLTIILLSATLIFLTSCRKQNDKITFAVGGAPTEVDYWVKIIEDFNRSTGFNFDLLRQPTDTDQRRQSLAAPLKAGQSDPDIFLMDVAWVAQFAASGWLFPLDSLIDQDKNFDEKVLFKPVVEQTDIFSGKTIALPVYVDCGLLYYRKDLLKKHDCSVPKTWSELAETAQQIQKLEKTQNPSFAGYVWQGAQYEGLTCNFLEFIASNNGEILNQNSEIVLDRPENIEALTFMKDLIHRYAVSPPNTFTEMKEEEVRTFFQSGDALFERNWPYAWKLHQAPDSPVRGKTGAAVLPRFEEGRHAAVLGGWHIGISKFSDQPEKAWKFLTYVLSYEIQKKIALNLGWNPGREDVYSDPDVLKELPHMDVIRKAAENSVARPNLPYYTQISEVIQKYVNSAIADRKEPSEALNQAQQEIKAVMDAYDE